MAIQADLLAMVDEDTRAFKMVMDAIGMPKASDADKALRQLAIQEANKNALEVPLKVMKRTFDSFEIIKAMAETGNPNSVSDAGVGAICARGAIMGAYLNVKINATGIDDHEYVKRALDEGGKIEAMAVKAEEEILQIVNGRIK
jgi:glutamate formiminotransferase/formiminotetrahydrofolate cyclodeaminase